MVVRARKDSKAITGRKWHANHENVTLWISKGQYGKTFFGLVERQGELLATLAGMMKFWILRSLLGISTYVSATFLCFFLDRA